MAPKVSISVKQNTIHETQKLTTKGQNILLTFKLTKSVSATNSSNSNIILSGKCKDNVRAPIKREA